MIDFRFKPIFLKTAILFTFLQFSVVLFADIPHYDIVEIMFNNKKYYVKEYFNEGGVLKNHDLCYYDYSGEYIGEVRDYVLKFTNNEDSITLYSSMEKLNVKKLNCYETIDNGEENFDDVIKIFNGELKITIKQFKEQFILLDAYHGNTGGFTFSPDLKETDNIWLSQYPIENLFCLDGQDICNFGFYTIKGNLSKIEKRKLKSEIEYLLSSFDLDILFWKKISELYNRQIIMVGYCSC